LGIRQAQDALSLSFPLYYPDQPCFAMFLPTNIPEEPKFVTF